MHLIAFTGPRGVGKTTISKTIVRLLQDKNNVYPISFAEFLRDWISECISPTITALSNDRLTKERPIGYTSLLVNINNMKVTIPIRTDLSPRDILILVGTFLRTIDIDIFCNALGMRIKAIVERDPEAIILVDDLRFENELNFLRSLNIPKHIVYLDRADNKLDLEGIHDYINPEACDISFVTWTYGDPLSSPQFRDEIKNLISQTLDISLSFEYSKLLEVDLG